MKKLCAIILACLLLTMGFGCGKSQASPGVSGKAMDFELKDINGNPFKLSDYSGKVIILNFFATWCPPCRMEMPDFNELSGKYPDALKIVGVNVAGESLSKVKEFAGQNGLTFTIVLDDGKVSRDYGPIRAIPVTVVINKNFEIAKKYIGARSKEDFEKDVLALK